MNLERLNFGIPETLKLITPHTIVADILARHNELIPVFSRFGVRLGVGDKTVLDICIEHDLNIDFVLTVLNVYVNETYLPDSVLSLFEAELIAEYFQRTAKNYLRDLVPNIEKHLHAFIALSDSKNKELAILRGLFAQFKEKLTSSLQSGVSHSDNFPDDLLHDLKNILIKHISGEYNQNLCHAVIFSISSLEKDLSIHNRLRSKVLHPKLEELNSADRRDLQQFIDDGKPTHPHEKENHLTSRETEILKLIVQGLLNKEIADRLNISLNTVLTHRKNIIAKTGIKTVSGLTFYCIRNGLTNI
jgi:DNA-binding CsgD family transcriptional regulator